jgi:hypothetical protein
MRIEQHFMRLQQIRSNDERAAVAQLEMCGLQLDPLAAHHGPIFAPVELKRLARLENQPYEGAPTGRLLLLLPILPPVRAKAATRLY